MSSQASWQTSGAGTGGTGWGDGFNDRQSIDNLLRRLVQQVEETERRYGEALDELQTRLDRLAHKTDATRGTSGAGDAPAFGRLHDQVSGLARQLGSNVSAPLNDFERLGRAVTGSPDRDAGGGSGPSQATFASHLAAEQASAPTSPSPFPLPFATAPAGSARAPAPFAEPPHVSLPHSPQAEADRDLSNRLVEMAHRLEHSVEAAMTPNALDALNARIDAIGRQIANAFNAPKTVSLEPLERQVSDIANQLRQAEGQLARIGEVETSLHRLIEHVDGHANDLSEVAAKAATEAARLVANDAKLDAATAERLDHMHRDLKEMSARSSAADDRLAGLVESVHDSLKHLVQQVERNTKAPEPTPNVPFVERMSGGKVERPRTAPSQSCGSNEPGGGGGQPSPKSDLRTPLLGGEKSPNRSLESSHIGDRAVDLDQGKQADPEASRTSRILPRKAARIESEIEDDLVAEARRAAKAAALKAAERTGEAKQKWTPSGTEAPSRVGTLAAEAPARRGRSLLIVFAALLLALSAVLLYGRLQPKPWLEFLQPASEQSAPRPATPSRNVPVQGTGKSAHAVEPASLRPVEAPALPPGVVLWVEEPAPSH